MVQAATSPKLKQLFQAHQQESRSHLDRLKHAFQILAVSPEGNFCEPTQGLVKEAQEVLGEGLPGEILDVALVMAAQKIEHYEIASYGSLHSVAMSCGLENVGMLLEQTLYEEKADDQKLTDLAESDINETAAAKAA